MAGIESRMVYQNEYAVEPEITKIPDKMSVNVKVGCSGVCDCETLSQIRHNNSAATEVIPDKASIETSKVSRKEKVVPNGCLKHKLGENGLVTHGVANVLSECSHKEKKESEVCCNNTSQNASGAVLSAATTVDPLANSSHTETACLLLEKAATKVSERNQDASLCGVMSELTLSDCDVRDGIEYVVYESELQMPDIMRLITKDLSEPYSIYTYRYFIHNWPKLCFLAMSSGQCVGAIVCKLDMHKKMVRRGYIAMLAIDSEFRRKKIGSRLVLKAIKAMIADDCDEVVLETEITNKAALRLYENLGFVRDKRLFRYYLNGVDALRLKLWLR